VRDTNRLATRTHPAVLRRDLFQASQRGSVIDLLTVGRLASIGEQLPNCNKAHADQET